MSTGTGAATALLAPIVCFGVPAAAWRAFRRRERGDAARIFAAWLAAALPALLIVYL